MTAGKKIQLHRKIKQMTQKTLSELSGVSEISIRKYEAGERNPKPEQLKKIADALEIGENLLTDINLSKLQLETVGDFMSIFLLLKETLGVHFESQCNEDGSVNPNSITVHFYNDKVNQELVKLMLAEKELFNRKNFISNIIPPLETADKEKLMAIDLVLLNATKDEMRSNEESLFDEDNKRNPFNEA